MNFVVCSINVCSALKQIIKCFYFVTGFSNMGNVTSTEYFYRSKTQSNRKTKKTWTLSLQRAEPNVLLLFPNVC